MTNMTDTQRKAVSTALMGTAPKTTRKEIQVIYYGDCPTYVRVTTQVAGSHTHSWGALHRGLADKVAQQMLETEEYKGYTLTREVR